MQFQDLAAQWLKYWPIMTLLIFLFIQLYYILFVYARLGRYSDPSATNDTKLPELSVLISARNEQENIRQFLPSILSQDYPTFEVILINDCSEDETHWVAKELQQQSPHLKIVDIAEHIRLKHNKKFALTIGIKATKYEHLVFTDADCQPSSDQWLRQMAAKFDQNKEIILGYSPYIKAPGLLNKLIRFETTHTAMSYLSYALAGDAYMGVGRNLAYTKTLFYRGKGFNSHMHIKSGDDDLFVNQNATAQNVAIAIEPEAHVLSVPKDTWKSYYKQKARHSGASVLYQPRHKKMLAKQLISAIAFYSTLALSIALMPSLWYVPVGIYLIRYICQLIIYSKIYKKLDVIDLIYWLPLLDLMYYFYICLNGIFNRNKKQHHWK